MAENNKTIEQLSINTIRFLAVDGVQKANSGHPGMPMGCAPIGYMLYAKLMKHNPANPHWLNRDRFILSAGHGSMLLYSLLHLSGYDLPLEQLKQFRQWGSKTPGHPEYGLTPGVETTTGPLGQGFANAVGMAIAQAHLAALFNKNDIKIIDHYIYGICSDGEMMEGISHEAASLAGHLKLGKIIFFYDDNKITIDGSTALSFSEDIEKRFGAYNWHIQTIENVNDIDSIDLAVKNARAETTRPSLIITKTHIGFGSPNKHDTSAAHGSPLGTEEVKLTKKNLGWPEEPDFYIPNEVAEHFKIASEKGKQFEKEWDELFKHYEAKYPDDAKYFKKIMSGDFGDEWKSKLPIFADEGKKIATRTSSGKVLNTIAPYLTTLIGGSADLHPSTDTFLKEFGSFSAENYLGRTLHYGIREHAMGSLLNGMALYGGVIPFGSTFLMFCDYMRPVIRLASISKIKPIYVFTHDSIGVGEDGPTHQPVEQAASLRCIPFLIVIRPGDANESAYAWKYAIEHNGSPVAILLTRQGMPVIDQNKYPSAKGLLRGAYILSDSQGEPEIIIMASGSEVSISLQAGEKLRAEGKKVRVVSFPSWELFEQQSEEYKESVFPSAVKARVSVEAGVKMGWEKYTGDGGENISVEKFGSSAPVEIVMEKYGFTANNVYETAKRVLAKNMK